MEALFSNCDSFLIFLQQFLPYFLYPFFCQIILCIYFALTLTIFPDCFHNIFQLFLYHFVDGGNFALVLAIFLCFFHNKYYLFFRHRKKMHIFKMIQFLLLNQLYSLYLQRYLQSNTRINFYNHFRLRKQWQHH